MKHTVYYTLGGNIFVAEYCSVNQELEAVHIKHHNAEIPFDADGLYLSDGEPLLDFLELKAQEAVENELPATGPDPYP